MNIGYLYLMEMMPKHSQTTVGSTWGVCDAMIYLFATIYFWQIGKDWYFVGVIGFLMNLFTSVTAWFLPESPRYLLEKGEIEELETTMAVVARVNNKPVRFVASHYRSKD
mmetsp:Transcript_24333/g.30181  ORF Transcript_24333/g.30181 Transcript_24333/m.30181 type:complete len:110 (-) Transcript_24333:793-1122(-)